MAAQDDFIDVLQQEVKQLTELMESYREFRQKLESLPSELAQKAKQALASDRLGFTDNVTAELIGRDMVGKTALECAKIILTEGKNEPKHFGAIAKEALKRGYKGRLKGDPEEVETRTVQSFWAALSRSADFEGIGKGCYRLKK